MPTLRTGNTLPQQDCLPQKGKPLSWGKANPTGQALQPTRPLASSRNLNQTSSGSPHLLGKGQTGTQNTGKNDLRRLDQSLLCHKPQQDKQLGLQEGPLTAQSCTWLVPAGAATVLVPAARCPQPSPSPGLPERAILTSQCQWGGSAGTHRSGPGGPGSAAG